MGYPGSASAGGAGEYRERPLGPPPKAEFSPIFWDARQLLLPLLSPPKGGGSLPVPGPKAHMPRQGESVTLPTKIVTMSLTGTPVSDNVVTMSLTGTLE